MRIKIKDKYNFIKMFNEIFENNRINKINSITIDSRQVKQNDIFIPIKGKNVDGHNFINHSFKNGAQICFSEVVSSKQNIIKVNSTKKIIETLAKAWKNRMKSKIIGITGSNGKTTTKDLLHLILSQKFKCSKSEGNYNSKIGLPLSFLNSYLNDDFCILEYGANKPNEIDYLCKIIKPDFGLITNISNAHIGNFSSVSDIVKTKKSIYTNLLKTDIGFVNNDDKNISKLNLKCEKITFAYENKSRFCGKIKNKNKKKYLCINNKDDILIPNSLMHLKESLLAVYIISKFFEIKSKDVADAFNSFTLPKGRGQKFSINGHEIIDDSYNANPKSMQLAIKRLEEEKVKDGRKILIFADMLELGKQSKKQHAYIGEILNNSKIDIILTYGILSSVSSKKIKNNHIHNKHYNSILELKNDLKKIIKANDLIYLKGSRSMQLEKIYLKD